MDRKTENQLRQEIAEVWALLDAERAGRAALIRRIEQEEQSVPVEVSDSPCAEADGCPTEKSVLQRFWREAQSVPVGLKVSVDVGTGEHDSFNRVFATVTGQQDDGQGGVILLCEEESRNFEQSVAVVGEPVAWDNFPGYLIDHQEGSIVTEENLQFWLSAFIKNTDYNKPAESITAAELAAIAQGKGE